ncbi:MAG: Rrf2 family transcriptional regulator [Chthonomonadales bacterium]
MISQTAEYALRAVAHLAQHRDEPRTAQQISDATLVPVHYLSKVLQNLVRGGILQTQRGLHGGCLLLKSPEELTIFEIVDAVDPLKRIRTCPLGIVQHGSHLCPLHLRLDKVYAQVEASFKESTLADILNEPSSSTPLCPLPQK